MYVNTSLYEIEESSSEKDLFNVKFVDGPYGVRFQVKCIIEHYMTPTDSKGLDANAILCVMNDIYTEINTIVISFISTLIDVMVPNTMGMMGTLAPLLEKYSHKIYKKTLNSKNNQK